MKETYISETEHEKCQYVTEAFTELFEQHDTLVLDAGKYGFVKLQYYSKNGFDDISTFTDSEILFENLWEEWLNLQLLSLAKKTPMADMDYEDIFHCLPPEKQKELMEKHSYFKQKAFFKYKTQYTEP